MEEIFWAPALPRYVFHNGNTYHRNDSVLVIKAPNPEYEIARAPFDLLPDGRARVRVSIDTAALFLPFFTGTLKHVLAFGLYTFTGTLSDHVQSIHNNANGINTRSCG
jgi:hypothetical protein